VHLGFRGSGRFLDGELRASANVSNTVSQGRDVFTTSARVSYPAPWGSDVSFRLRHTRFTGFADRPGFQESFATFTLSRSF
jgi:hypothetical protein